MEKSHQQAKSVTFSDHTLHAAGFVHKIRTRDKIKTVRISPVEAKKTAANAYRNVSISHIKSLRKKLDVEANTLNHSGAAPLSRFSFFNDQTLSHALNPQAPIKSGYDTSQLEQFFDVNPNRAQNTSPMYKKEALIAIQSRLSISQRQQFAIARIRSPELGLIDFIQQNGLLTPELRQILETGANKENEKLQLSFDAFNFKPPRVMALDIGTQYIGIALSNEDCTESIPFNVINLLSTNVQNYDAKSFMQEIQPSYRIQPVDVAHQLNAIRTQYNVVCTVVGIPQSNFNTQLISKIQSFTANMQQLCGIGQGPYELCYVDEHHSSQEARKHLFQDEEWEEKEAEMNRLHSTVGEGGERRKRLFSKSKHHDDAFQKKKGLDAFAAAVILDRFLEIEKIHGPVYSPKVHERLFSMFGPNQIHTM